MPPPPSPRLGSRVFFGYQLGALSSVSWAHKIFGFLRVAEKEFQFPKNYGQHFDVSDFQSRKTLASMAFCFLPAAAITETQRKKTGNLVVFLKVFNNLTHHSDNNEWMNK
jgi:hypothetical protein